MGSLAIQIAKLHGAEVAITASTPDKRERCIALGADHAWAYEDVRTQSRAWTDKRGVDIVIDHVGSSTWSDSVRALARGGSLVTCGATSGHEAAIDLRVLFFKQLNLLGSHGQHDRDARGVVRSQQRRDQARGRSCPADDAAR